jgi:FtsP/CotA-like multicopper oxidase with cupredoxin domain
MGNEAGFLAAPVDIPSTPINYEYNKRSVTVLNVLEHGLFLSTAGRADTVVDFSAFAGKTLILYNDNPAPMPAGDPRLDYYTGVGDQTGAGGADNTLPGYGPNTRTVMQVKVNAAAAPVTPFNFAKLDKAITDNVAAGQQEPPIVPQMAYSPSFGTAAPYNTDTFGNIFTGAIYLGNYKPITFTTTTSTLYTPAPGSVTKCGTPALCNAQLTAIKAAGPVLVPAGTKISAYLENKTIQELFDSTWGRMNATLGTELPFVNVNIATTIPLGYVDPATEALADGETQFWKITHNGVDSHPVHFHLVNVQVINRMGWDGTVKAPYPEDIGWKETLIMNPLEDVLVAVRSKKPVAPFALPHSYRAMDPSQPMGAMGGFTQIDPVTGNPKVVANAMDDFMNEYVWHCHILGHEENDFMRPIKFDSKDQTPDAPTIGTALAVAGGVEVKWTDPTPVGNVTTPGNPKNEFGFRVERAQVINAVTGAFAAVGKTTAYTQLTPPATRVINTLANATSYIDATASAPLAPTAGTLNSVVLNAAGTSATLSFSGATNQSSISIVRNGVTIKTGLAAGTTSYVDSTVTGLNVTYTYQVVAVAADNTYSYRVIGVNAAGETTSTKSAQAVLAGSSVLSNSVAVTTPSVSLAAATGLAAQVVSQTPTGGGNLTGLTFQLNWTDASTGETGYKVEVCHGSATQCTAASATATPIGTTANLWYPVPAGLITSTPPAAATGGQYVATVGTLPATNTRYYFRVSPLSGVTAGPVSNISAAINLNNTPAAPTGVTAASNAAGQLTVSWTDAANSNQATQVQYALARTLSTLTINNPGRGYTSAPTVTIVPNAADAGRIAIPATATATLGTGATAGRVVGLTITNPGAGYTQAPTVVFSGGTPTTAANATANITGNPNYTTVPAGANGVATSQTISGLTSGKAYLIRAAAVGVSGSGGNSATATNNGLPVVVK